MEQSASTDQDHLLSDNIPASKQGLSFPSVIRLMEVYHCPFSWWQTELEQSCFCFNLLICVRCPRNFLWLASPSSRLTVAGVCRRLSSFVVCRGLYSVTFHGGPAGGIARTGQAMTSCRLQSNYSSTAARRASRVTWRKGDTLFYWTFFPKLLQYSPVPKWKPIGQWWTTLIFVTHAPFSFRHVSECHYSSASLCWHGSCIRWGFTGVIGQSKIDDFLRRNTGPVSVLQIHPNSSTTACRSIKTIQYGPIRNPDRVLHRLLQPVSRRPHSVIPVDHTRIQQSTAWSFVVFSRLQCYLLYACYFVSRNDTDLKFYNVTHNINCVICVFIYTTSLCMLQQRSVSC